MNNCDKLLTLGLIETAEVQYGPYKLAKKYYLNEYIELYKLHCTHSNLSTLLDW